MTKQESLFLDLKAAFTKFEEALKLFQEHQGEKTQESFRDSLIHRFEFTFELSWKLMQQCAKEASLEDYGPKNSVRNAAKLGLISDPELWFEFIEQRNLVSHTYIETIASNLAEKLPNFSNLVSELIKNTPKFLS